ncbi:MAG TPA: mechanosensitive ion channel family protein [Acidimicrobiales bacterium]|nr:mechanosensitive ion channel family protein [Acidimicrobiales bacterium]
MAAAITPLSDFSTWARSSALEIVMYVTGAILITRLATWTSGKVTDRIDRHAQGGDALVRSEEAKHRHAVTGVVTWSVLVLVYFVTGVLVIQKLGVPLTSLVAPATVAGVAVGFGAQRVVQDILAGFFIVTERQYGFGDVVRISPLGGTTGVTGTVEEVTLRVTRLRNISGEVIFVPNGQIVQVINLSRDWARAVIDVPVPSSADVSGVTSTLREVGKSAFTDDQLRPLLLDAPSVMGVESLGVDQLVIRVVARILPGKQFDVSRELRQRIAVAFREEGIAVLTTSETADAESQNDPAP